jgi:hypothetical protein
LGDKPREIGRVRTLDDGTFLFRKNKTTPTYHLTAEQYDKIRKLRVKEYAAAWLLAPLFLPFIFLSLDGNLGSRWKIAAVCALFYCHFNFFFSRKIWHKITEICEEAGLAPPEQSNLFLGSSGILRESLALTSDNHLMIEAVGFTAMAAVSSILLMSIFVDLPYFSIPQMYWIKKLFVGAASLVFFGGFAFISIKEILRRRNAKLQNPDDETSSKT